MFHLLKTKSNNITSLHNLKSWHHIKKALNTTSKLCSKSLLDAKSIRPDQLESTDYFKQSIKHEPKYTLLENPIISNPPVKIQEHLSKPNREVAIRTELSAQKREFHINYLSLSRTKGQKDKIDMYRAQYEKLCKTLSVKESNISFDMKNFMLYCLTETYEAVKGTIEDLGAEEELVKYALHVVTCNRYILSYAPTVLFEQFYAFMVIGPKLKDSNIERPLDLVLGARLKNSISATEYKRLLAFECLLRLKAMPIDYLCDFAWALALWNCQSLASGRFTSPKSILIKDKIRFEYEMAESDIKDLFQNISFKLLKNGNVTFKLVNALQSYILFDVDDEELEFIPRISSILTNEQNFLQLLACERVVVFCCLCERNEASKSCLDFLSRCDKWLKSESKGSKFPISLNLDSRDLSDFQDALNKVMLVSDKCKNEYAELSDIISIAKNMIVNREESTLNKII